MFVSPEALLWLLVCKCNSESVEKRHGCNLHYARAVFGHLVAFQHQMQLPRLFLQKTMTIGKSFSKVQVAKLGSDLPVLGKASQPELDPKEQIHWIHAILAGMQLAGLVLVSALSRGAPINTALGLNALDAVCVWAINPRRTVVVANLKMRFKLLLLPWPACAELVEVTKFQLTLWMPRLQ